MLINVLIKPIYIFFINSRVQDTLGPDIFGKYFGIFNFAYILYIITDFGIQNYNSVTVSKDHNLLKEYLPNILGLKTILSFIYIVVGLIVGYFIGYDAESLRLFLFIAINLILLSFVLYLRTNISALGKFRWDSLISVIDKIILIIVLGYFLFTSFVDSFSIEYFLFAQTFAFLVVLLVVLSINFNLADKLSIKFSMSFARRILKKSLPYSLVFILMTLYMKMDGFMLERMLDGSYEAGKYSAAFTLYEAFNNIGYLFAVLLLPMFASIINSEKQLKPLIQTSHNLILVIAATASLITIFYSENIMSILYPQTYTESHSKILIILMFSFIAITLTYIYGTLITAAGKIKTLNRIVMVGVIINLILNLILIPKKGAYGAAIATVFTQYFVLFSQYMYGLKEFKIGFNYIEFFKRMAFVVVAGFIVYAIKNNIEFNWLIQIIFSGFGLLLIAYFIGLIKVSDLKK